MKENGMCTHCFMNTVPEQTTSLTPPMRGFLAWKLDYLKAQRCTKYAYCHKCLTPQKNPFRPSCHADNVIDCGMTEGIISVTCLLGYVDKATFRLAVERHQGFGLRENMTPDEYGTWLLADDETQLDRFHNAIHIFLTFVQLYNL